jgi:hypothetical protein
MNAKSAELKRKYLLPSDLARMVGCSQKKIRDYCKSGKIPEAKKTPGGQWRIAKPLSRQTRGFLQMKAFQAEWPWIGKKEAVGEFDDSDTAQSLMEAILWGNDECIPPYDEVDVGPVKSAALVRIQSLIWEKIKNQESLSSLILSGWVYQFWLKHQREPTVPEVAELMHISRSEFYRRRHNLEEIRKAYDECEPIGEGPVGKAF